MILVELNGGLGNQLFQYAAGKSLSLYHNTDLWLAYSTEQNLPGGLESRPFDLYHFTIPDKMADPVALKFFSSLSFYSKFLDKLKPPHKRKIYRQSFFHFDPHFFQAKSTVFLKGLWQSEKFFLPFQKEIRQLLQFTEISLSLNSVANKMKHENSISIHIRRGDYLAKISLDVLGIQPLSYYQEAINIILSKTDNPVFYFFSDDIEWVKENFQMPGAIYTSNYITKSHIEDLYLMSHCQHNIIANSSFSWWGAWLNNNPGKIVIGPKNWFNKGPKDTQDILPENWIRI